jgi:hypothetical protein
VVGFGHDAFVGFAEIERDEKAGFRAAQTEPRP